MGSLFFILLIAAMFKGSSKDRRRGEIFKLLAGLFVAGAILSILFSPIGFFGILMLISFVCHKAKKKVHENKVYERNGWNEMHTSSNNSSNGQYQYNTQCGPAKGGVSSYILPKSIKKRRKIIANFNKQFNLTLTEDQVTSMANSSFISEIWKSEVESMTIKYNMVDEWLTGGVSWLRTYIYVFQIQEIAYDIAFQENIATYAFEDVMKYADTLEGYSLAEKIRKINNKYLTMFNEVTFSIAYHFLENKGYKHKCLSGEDLIRNETEIEKLMHEIDNKSAVHSDSTAVDAALNELRNNQRPEGGI